MNDKAEYQRGRDLSTATGLAGGTAKICSMGFLESKVPKLSSRFHIILNHNVNPILINIKF